MPAKKKQGGKRPGSGRKPTGAKRVQKTVTLRPETLAKIPGRISEWIENDPRLK